VSNNVWRQQACGGLRNRLSRGHAVNTAAAVFLGAKNDTLLDFGLAEPRASRRIPASARKLACGPHAIWRRLRSRGGFLRRDGNARWKRAIPTPCGSTLAARAAAEESGARIFAANLLVPLRRNSQSRAEARRTRRIFRLVQAGRTVRAKASNMPLRGGYLGSAAGMGVAGARS